MILSESRRFIFVHNYKTGGESVAAALTPYLDRDDVALNHEFQLLGAAGPRELLTTVAELPRRRRIGRARPELRPLSKHSSALEIRACVPAELWNDSYKFAFVRHPVDRTISLYRYCARMMDVRQQKKFPVSAWYVTPWGKRTDPRHWPAIRAFAGTSSFSEFIRHPALDDEGAMRPQADSVCGLDGEILVDFVARFERFDEDFAEIQTSIGVPRGTAAKRNVSGTASTPSITRASLSDDDRNHLAQRFAVDFARLGYDL